MGEGILGKVISVYKDSEMKLLNALNQGYVLRKQEFVGEVSREVCRYQEMESLSYEEKSLHLFIFIHLSDILTNNIFSCGFHVYLFENRYFCVKAFNQETINKIWAFEKANPMECEKQIRIRMTQNPSEIHWESQEVMKVGIIAMLQWKEEWIGGLLNL